MKSKYLVRPGDMHIFEIDESNGCYRSYMNRDVTDGFGNRPNAYEHFNYDNLTQNYNFFPINENDLAMYKYFHDIYCQYLDWTCRPDGHGGAKGGTFKKFIESSRNYD